VTLTGDDDLAVTLADDLLGIVEHHVAGTRFGIGVDPADGLLTQGADGWALTWMDARVDSRPITPRAGKTVEVNALWINGLAAIVGLLARAGRDSTAVATLEAQARSSFGARFRSTGRAGLADVIDGQLGDDWSVRPNQLLAASLPHGPFADGSVVTACGPLVTSLGLRSLSPADPRYRSHHRGGPAERDEAYHQGTVWPWLIGPYVGAVLRTGGSANGLLDGLEAHLADWGLGSVSETTDAHPPHQATGCPFQAWSVAELIRARALTRAAPPDGSQRVDA
jgi:predicted glycogen debranching enzyme